MTSAKESFCYLWLLILRSVRQVMVAGMSILVALLVSGCPEIDESGGQSMIEESNPSQAPDEHVELIDGENDDLVILRLFKRHIMKDGKLWKQKLGERGGGKSWHYPVRERVRRLGGLLHLWMSDSSNHSGDRSGYLSQLMRLLFGDFTVLHILISVDEVLVKSQGEWQVLQTFEDGGRHIDLLKLHTSGFSSLGMFSLPHGHYEGVRLRLANDHHIAVDEGAGEKWRSMKILGSKHHMDIMGAFTISANVSTSLHIDFAVEKSVMKIFNAYLLKPDFSLRAIEVGNTLQAEIGAGSGGSLTIADQVAVHFSDESFPVPTLVTLEPLQALSPHGQSFIKIGQEYLLTADGFDAVSVPMELSLTYHADYLSAHHASEGMVDLFWYDEEFDRWDSLQAVQVQGTFELQAQAWRLGRFVVGIHRDDVSGQLCNFGEASLASPREWNLDSNYFTPSCQRFQYCLDHGLQTYGKDSSGCLTDYGQDMVEQCQNLCLSFDESRCTDIDEQGWLAMSPLALELFESCDETAESMYAVAETSLEHEAPSQSSCYDYDQLGVSCEMPTCQLVSQTASVPLGEVVQLEFLLAASGSVTRIEFEGQMIEVTSLPALPSDYEFNIVETDRVLLQDKHFTAKVWGAGSDEPVSCTVPITVVDLRPCTLAIVPDHITGGETAALLMTVRPGWSNPTLDIRSEGIFSPIALSLPDEEGLRYYHSMIRPPLDRAFTGRVVNGSDETYECQASIRVE